jgi:hypothetical protein
MGENVAIRRYGAYEDGPEMDIQRVLVCSLEDLFGINSKEWWQATSFPVGASRPDLLLAAYKPILNLLSESGSIHYDVISYLYGVRRARPETISARLGEPISKVVEVVDSLLSLEITGEVASSYYLNPEWRNVLPRIVSIEVKVKNWRRAIQQARLNLAFSHQTYIAMPERIAKRIITYPEIQSTSIGLISIRQDRVSILRNADKLKPSVPSYYYKIAGAIANTH